MNCLSAALMERFRELAIAILLARDDGVNCLDDAERMLDRLELVVDDCELIGNSPSRPTRPVAAILMWCFVCACGPRLPVSLFAAPRARKYCLLQVCTSHMLLLAPRTAMGRKRYHAAPLEI